jgi:hypothetical protein
MKIFHSIQWVIQTFPKYRELIKKNFIAQPHIFPSYLYYAFSETHFLFFSSITISNYYQQTEFGTAMRLFGKPLPASRLISSNCSRIHKSLTGR